MENEKIETTEETVVRDKVAIVTGGSSGIGLEAAKAVSAAGCQVYAFSRKDIEFKDIAHMSVDVTDEKAVIKAVKTIMDIEGKIDIKYIFIITIFCTFVYFLSPFFFLSSCFFSF